MVRDHVRDMCLISYSQWSTFSSFCGYGLDVTTDNWALNFLGLVNFRRVEFKMLSDQFSVDKLVDDETH